MASCRLTRQQYDALVEAFRTKPGNFAAASRVSGVDQRTAARAWKLGWPRPDWAKSIKELFEAEQVAARAQLHDEEAQSAKGKAELREVHRSAELDAVEERKREARAVRAAMSSSMAALAVSGQMANARLELTKQAAKDIADAARTGQISWQEAIPLIAKLQWLDGQAVKQLEKAMDVLRLHVGDPGKFVSEPGHDERAPEVDGELAAEALGGEEQLRQAVRDLADKKMTPLVERLLEHQLEARAKFAPS